MGLSELASHIGRVLLRALKESLRTISGRSLGVVPLTDCGVCVGNGPWSRVARSLTKLLWVERRGSALHSWADVRLLGSWAWMKLLGTWTCGSPLISRSLLSCVRELVLQGVDEKFSVTVHGDLTLMLRGGLKLMRSPHGGVVLKCCRCREATRAAEAMRVVVTPSTAVAVW